MGLGAANAPKIYLDAAAVSVDYVDTPEATTDITPQDQDQQDQDQADSSTIPDVPPPPPAPVDAFQKTPTVLTDVFDQGARQQCVVAPFSQRVSPGENTDLSLQLFSDLTTPSSTPKKGVPTSTLPDGYQHAMYQTSVGSLPVGVSAYIASGGASSDTSSTQTIHVNVNSAASPGSYSLLVIYRERQDDASMRSTGCQFNLIVQ